MRISLRSRFLRHVVATAWLAAPSLGASVGCSLLGTPAGVPEGLPHAGVGPFRDLILAETRLSPPGVPVALRNMAAERPMQAGLHLFYAGASTVMPMMDAGVPEDAGEPLDGGVDAGRLDAGPPADEPTEIDWSLFVETRRIYRSPPHPDNWGFSPGEVVLAPEGGPAWEGGYVTDPWALETDDGALLYYAAEGGIGVAEASAIDGDFARVGSAPILGVSGGDVPRCPTVVRTDGLDAPDASPPLGGYYMVYELGGRIHAASSSDGRSFTDRGPIEIPALRRRDVRDGNEVAVGCPGMVIAAPTTGRHILRVYYESRRDNDATLIGMMASLDGVAFEFHPTPVLREYDRGMPAPRVVDSRITLLFHWAPDAVRGVAIGQLRISVAPGGVQLTGGDR